MGPNVIIDTNVIVSALGWSGPSRTVVDLLARDEISLFLSPGTLAELERVISYRKLGFTESRKRRFLAFLSRHSRMVSPILRVARVVDDPSDDKFLELAEAADADYLITGDRHLLALKHHGRTRIVTPRAFLSILDSG